MTWITLSLCKMEVSGKRAFKSQNFICWKHDWNLTKLIIKDSCCHSFSNVNVGETATFFSEAEVQLL